MGNDDSAPTPGDDDANDDATDDTLTDDDAAPDHPSEPVADASVPSINDESDSGSSDGTTDDGSEMTPQDDAGKITDAEVLARVTVSAGPLDRDHCIVSFPYPSGAGSTLVLRDEAGTAHPVQVDEAGQASFVLRALAAGQQASFDLRAANVEAATSAAEVDGAIRLGVSPDDTAQSPAAMKTVAEFQLGTQPPAEVDAVYARGGYLHPLYTPSGVLLTDDYPDDHYHHHGVWSAWTRASRDGHEVDFWNVQSGQGRVDLGELQRTWQGPVHAGLEATLAHVDLVDTPTTALSERWLVRVYKTHAGSAPYFVVDLESTQNAATTSAIELLEYTYGGFGLRGHAQWRDVDNAVFLTSEGHDRIAGDDQVARWCFLGGNVDGVPVGYAALGHPDNFRAPQKLRIHPTDPFVTFSPVKDGPFTIEPGAAYVTRLRLILMDGAPDVALLERLWNDYATPVEVSVTHAAP